MRLITSEKQLVSNLEVVENYLAEGKAKEKQAITDLIRKGRCFVAYKSGNEYRFAPSRFLGYINNHLNKHYNHIKQLDGRLTNPAITKALQKKLIPSNSLDLKYIKYCKNLGAQPSQYSKRRYWVFELKEDFIANRDIDALFPEGKLVERIHLSRERNSKVVQLAKENFKAKHGRLFCQVCKIDFEKKYGKLGKDFIEAHHTIPVSEMEENHQTSPDEIAMLCPNCHRMAHKKRPWLSMKDLKSLLK